MLVTMVTIVFKTLKWKTKLIRQFRTIHRNLYQMQAFTGIHPFIRL